jgi:hypothetical protein
MINVNNTLGARRVSKSNLIMKAAADKRVLSVISRHVQRALIRVIQSRKMRQRLLNSQIWNLCFCTNLAGDGGLEAAKVSEADALRPYRNDAMSVRII